MTDSRTKLLVMAAVGMLVLAAVPATAVAQSSVTVATGNASAVTDEDATLHGNLTDLGHSDNASVWFTYWQASDPANTTNTTKKTVNVTGPFNETVSGLDANTTYSFQAHAEGSSGNTSTGAVVSFTTESTEGPTVLTTGASNVTADSAVLAGNLTDLGDSTNASVWIRYWVAADPANTTDTATTTVNDTGPFNRTVTGLAANTTYAFRVYAEGSTGDVANGSALQFTTGDADAADGLSIGVQQGAARVTIAVTDAANATAVPGANVTVTSADAYNGTGDYVTGDDGTVSIPAPEGNRSVTVTITAEADGKFGERTVTLQGTDGQGPAETPFGLTLASFVQSLKGLGVDGPLGQAISAFATANNPGADNKPDHAGGPDAAFDILFGDDADGNETDDRGPPEAVGQEDDGDETEAAGNGPPGADNGNGQGPPDHAQNDEDESESDEDDAEEDETDDEETDDEEGDDDADDEGTDDEQESDDEEASDEGAEDEGDDDNGQANDNGNNNGGGNGGNNGNNGNNGGGNGNAGNGNGNGNGGNNGKGN